MSNHTARALYNQIMELVDSAKAPLSVKMEAMALASRELDDRYEASISDLSWAPGIPTDGLHYAEKML